MDDHSLQAALNGTRVMLLPLAIPVRHFNDVESKHRDGDLVITSHLTIQLLITFSLATQQEPGVSILKESLFSQGL